MNGPRAAGPESDDLRRLAAAFGRLTGDFMAHEANQIELAGALCDDDALLKARIKYGVMAHARQMFQYCYRRVTGEEAPDEPHHA